MAALLASLRSPLAPSLNKRPNQNSQQTRHASRPITLRSPRVQPSAPSILRQAKALRDALRRKESPPIVAKEHTPKIAEAAYLTVPL
jgi:hypothetical protein